MKKIATVMTFLLAALAVCTSYADKTATQEYVNRIAAQTLQQSKTYVNQKLDRRYAMFIIPLNDKAYIGKTGHYCHFELKASTNNFSSAAKFDDRMCFYTHSAFADQEILDNDRVLLFINHGGVDSRSYIRISNTLEGMQSGYCPSAIIAIVDASLLNPKHSDGTWLHEANNDLMWTYVRSTDGIVEISSQAREQDVGGGDFLWRPIVPVRWFDSLPKWAKQPL